MKIIVCVDDRGGMMFNKRRQSQDYEVRKDILDMSAGRVCMNEYSLKQFVEWDNLTAQEDFLDKAGEDDYCFVENLPLEPYKDRINEIIIYHWNRKYPGDKFFDIDISAGWELIESSEFVGKAHECIRKERWLRV